ncbi:MAG: polyprenyl synthetase family protein [Bacteroidales bacterium]
MNNQELYLKAINKEIDKIQYPVAPKDLYDPIAYILDLGGKRIRPVLVLMASDIFSENSLSSMPAALAVEIFHNFTLLHDDVMDHADIRRGKPTVHKKWNGNAAILSGDAMLILAYQYLAKVDPDKLSVLLPVFSQTAIEVCEGQQYDMDFETRDDVTVDEYMEMIRLKTAVLLGCALKMGALHSGASISDADLLYRFGESIGLAFQLKDDLLDVYGDVAKFGKNIGGDITSNKKTFLLISALQNAKDEMKDELISWISETEFDREEKVVAVRSIYDSLNLKRISEEKMKYYYNMAIDALDQMSVSTERTANLRELAYQLMFRES